MAFGDYATLVSSFTGTDQNPLSEGGIWTNKIVTTDVNMRRLSNRAQSTAGAGSAWYNVAQYGPDMEVYATAPTKPDDADWFRLFARLQTPGTAGVDGYMLQVAAVAGTDTAELYRLTNGGFTQIGSTYSAEWNAGDKFGIECIGDAIKAYRNTGSGWTEIISTTDATYSTGYVGIGARDAATVDDFYAGVLPSLTQSGHATAGLTGTGSRERIRERTGAATVGLVGSGSKEYFTQSVFGYHAALIDDFNRADENPVSDSGRWTLGPMLFALNNARVVSQALEDSSSGGIEGNDYRNNATFGPDLQMHVTFAFSGGGGLTEHAALYGRLVNIGSGTTDGYSFEVTGNGVDHDCALYRIDNGTRTQLGSTTTVEFATGDKMGFEIRGSTLSGYRMPAGGSWAQLLSFDDTTYTAAGRVGVGVRSFQLDDFSGGTISFVDKTGHGVAGLHGAGVSAFFTKAGHGVAGTVGSGAKEHLTATYVKTGYGKVGTTTSGGSAAAEFNWEGVSIALGQTMFDAFVTWTRVDN